MIKRPMVKRSGAVVTVPSAETMIRLLGPGMARDGVVFTRDETDALNRLYGFEAEKPNERPPRPERPADPEGATGYERREADEKHKRAVAAWEAWEDHQPLMQAAADRNMARHADHDGLRLVAWLARFVPQGEDPMKTLVQLVVQAGWDVSPEDMSWAEDGTG